MATFYVDVCSATDAAGRTVRYNTPESLPIEHGQVRLVGTYVGADPRANGVIYLDPPSNSPHAILRVDTLQSKMAIHHLSLSARNSNIVVRPSAQAKPGVADPAAAQVEAALAIARAQAAAKLNPAPAPKPRGPLTTAGR